jgi:hypothetical protein
MSASASAMPMSDPSPRYASEGDETRARFRRSPSPVTQNVSVPEKILEHWASLCVAYRYRSLAAQWWPVNGVDIDLQALPAQPGKAIQLELKTITPAGWWFGDWMVVMTTQQVVAVLRQDLNSHRRRDRGVKRCLVQFDISGPGKPDRLTLP